MKRWFAFPAVLLAASCATAGFQFGRLDDDNDERISRKEAEGSAEVSAYFGLFDRNEDGYLDRGELEDGLEFIRASDTTVQGRGEDDRGGHRH